MTQSGHQQGLVPIANNARPFHRRYAMTTFIFDLDQVQNHRAQSIVMAFHLLGRLQERSSIYV